MEKRLLTQNLTLCAMITALGALATSISSLLDRIAEAIDLAPSSVGVFISVYMIGSCLSAFFGGSLADRLGKRRVIAAGTLLLSLGLVGVAALNGAALIFAGFFVLGVGFGPSESMGSALLTDENGPRATLWMNLSQIGFGIGAIAAPALIAAHLANGGGYKAVFLLCAVAFFAFFLVMSLGGRGNSVKVNPESGVNSFLLLKDGKFRLYAVLIFLYMGFESVAPAYLKRLFLEKGAGEETATLTISLFWAAMLVCRLIGAFLSGKELFSVKFFTLFVIAGIVLTLAAPNDALRIAGVSLYGFGCGPVWTMIFVLSARVFPDRIGAAYGVMMLFSTAGGAVFPAVIGAWVANTQVTFLLCILIAALLIAGAFWAGRMEEGRKIAA
jgi:FHS family glucose/mannose:H+ symporter-like MFS transporter